MVTTNSDEPIAFTETRQVKGALKEMPIKTIRRDAERIARLLHLGRFRPVHCKSVSAQEVRLLLAVRKAIKLGVIALERSLGGCQGTSLERFCRLTRSSEMLR